MRPLILHMSRAVSLRKRKTNWGYHVDIDIYCISAFCHVCYYRNGKIHYFILRVQLPTQFRFKQYL